MSTGLSLMKESEVDPSLNEYEELMKQITNCRQSDKQVLCVCVVCAVGCVVWCVMCVV